MTGRPAVSVIGKTIPAVTPLFLQNDLRATLTDFESNVRAYGLSQREAEQYNERQELEQQLATEREIKPPLFIAETFTLHGMTRNQTVLRWQISLVCCYDVVKRQQ